MGLDSVLGKGDWLKAGEHWCGSSIWVCGDLTRIGFGWEPAWSLGQLAIACHLDRPGTFIHGNHWDRKGAWETGLVLGQAESLGSKVLGWAWNHGGPPSARVNWEPGVPGASQRELVQAWCRGPQWSQEESKAPLSILGWHGLGYGL